MAVTGHVLRVARKSAGLTREELAERLGVYPTTVKRWETGERPLINATGRMLRAVRTQLQRAGVPAAVIRALDVAQDADLVLEQVLSGAPAKGWLLGDVVSWRELSDLILWPLSGVVPSAIAAAVDNPPGIRTAGAGELAAFFDGLRDGAEGSRSQLLRRQAIYLAGRDDRPDSRAWVADAERVELGAGHDADWLSTWMMHRSFAVARACQGDSDLLRRFVDRELAGDELAETLNVAYWCYWAIPGDPAASDVAMFASPTDQLPVGRLLHHLVDRLRPENPYIELSAHTVAAMVQRWPRLLLSDAGLSTRLATAATETLDGGTVDHQPTRRNLDRIRWAAEMTQENHR